ncbi:MAG: hypothetical protein LH702_17550 [Phormidesmis sp. CAN_BIN44]|nr:hypothetical protein [Phormidesmis sp. CAN_BIN44]
MSQNRFNSKKEKGKKIATPSQTRNASPEQQKPIFSLYYLNKDYCLSACDKDQKAAFADTLYKLSQITWNEIISSPRHGAGCERISRNSIRTSIPNHLKEDVNFIAFRFYGKAPMVGYRDENIFHVIWIDRVFSLYDHD